MFFFNLSNIWLINFFNLFLFLLPFYKDFISEELFKKFNDTSKLVIEMKYDELTKFKELLLKSLLIIITVNPEKLLKFEKILIRKFI